MRWSELRKHSESLILISLAVSPRSILMLAVTANFFATFGPEILMSARIPVLLPDIPEKDVPELLRGTIMISCHLAGLLGWIGMPLGWRPSRYLYLAAWVIALIGTLVAGPAAFSAIGIALIMCLGLTGGFLVCYVFFGDGRQVFAHERPNQAMQPTAPRSDA